MTGDECARRRRSEVQIECRSQETSALGLYTVLVEQMRESAYGKKKKKKKRKETRCGWKGIPPAAAAGGGSAFLCSHDHGLSGDLSFGMCDDAEGSRCAEAGEMLAQRRSLVEGGAGSGKLLVTRAPSSFAAGARPGFHPRHLSPYRSLPSDARAADFSSPRCAARATGSTVRARAGARYSSPGVYPIPTPPPPPPPPVSSPTSKPQINHINHVSTDVMDDAISLDASIDRFFLRAGLATRERLRCDAFIRTRYPDEQITPVSGQGYCSLTVFVGHTLVVQFRPPLFQLDLRVAHAARDVYAPFAPDTRYLGTLPSGLLAYSMSRIDGLSLQHWRRANPAAQSTEQRRRLCRDFAGFLARAWHHQSVADLPLGVVGLSLVSRLKALMTDLPVRFQSTARSLLRQLHRIEALPWVLSHGDIMAANMMVDPSSCRLIGLVDWAEAERLPFGVCFYGLEEILGEMTPSGFRVHPDAEDLRASFWEELTSQIPELQQSHVLEAVKLARDLGVLLWHGIAFDNGAINRVVEEGRDVEEIQRLDAFLPLHPEQHRDHFQGLSSKTLPIQSSTSIAPTLLPYPRDSNIQHVSAQ